jgi:hypothetical protein
MRLYHFTARDYLPDILVNGLTRGAVPTSPTEGFQAPWLTDDPDPTGARQAWHGPGKLAKSALRLTVDIPGDDPQLHYWPTLARALGVRFKWYQTVNRWGGGQAEHWYVYRGGIPPAWITEIMETRGPRAGQPYRAAKREHPKLPAGQAPVRHLHDSAAMERRVTMSGSLGE